MTEFKEGRKGAKGAKEFIHYNQGRKGYTCGSFVQLTKNSNIR